VQSRTTVSTRCETEALTAPGLYPAELALTVYVPAATPLKAYFPAESVTVVAPLLSETWALAMGLAVAELVTEAPAKRLRNGHRDEIGRHEPGDLRVANAEVTPQVRERDREHSGIKRGEHACQRDGEQEQCVADRPRGCRWSHWPLRL